jgi:hypothetical protein
MFRRRRRTREIEFSFDSFLDVVANVCGIIIRLILVTWAGSRAYHAAVAQHALLSLDAPAAISETDPETALPPLPAITDPLEQEALRRRAELAVQEQRLLEQLRQFDWLKESNQKAQGQMTSMGSAEGEAQQQHAALEKRVLQDDAEARAAEMSLAEFQRRSKKLAAELTALEKEPPPSKILKYLTPLSRPVHTAQLDFECSSGRVSFVDVEAFVLEAQRTVEDKSGTALPAVIEGVTGAVGAFKMHFSLERAGTVQVGVMGLPVEEKGYRYRLTEWIVEPVTPSRGETAAQALRAGSEFHRQVDAVDPERSVVTLWVYPDSFGIYRQLRDCLHEKGIEVAGRPLPPGTPIAGSARRGTVSRGQ